MRFLVNTSVNKAHRIRHYQIRPLWFGLFSLSVLVITICLALQLKTEVGASPLVKGTPVKHLSQSVAATLTTPVKTPSTNSPTPVLARHTPSVPNCSPDNVYSSPSAIDLSNQPQGLTQISDSTAYYQVFGNNATQVDAQVQECAPATKSNSGAGAEFAAETSYNLTYEYGWFINGDGTCTVTSAKVGLHLNMVMPDWQATAAAPPSLTASWQAYITGLKTHENGHVAIDQQYANQLLSDLNSFSSVSCSTIGSELQAKIQADVAALNAANDAYDASTNHGATQGAVLP